MRGRRSIWNCRTVADPGSSRVICTIRLGRRPFLGGGGDAECGRPRGTSQRFIYWKSRLACCSNIVKRNCAPWSQDNCVVRRLYPRWHRSERLRRCTIASAAGADAEFFSRSSRRWQDRLSCLSKWRWTARISKRAAALGMNECARWCCRRVFRSPG
jgi:hypothetical protein